MSDSSESDIPDNLRAPRVSDSPESDIHANGKVAARRWIPLHANGSEPHNRRDRT
ncbi:hypothetical protein HMPREF0168_1784 [Bifidobacterium dentium ATCC 27679]|uniref:Uncharacterized protein n=1 Tax=Bifidobacterium dentium ATCC 27679 TaxID=871562 RepID=E0Q9Y6_9BIFI|nr:hypothetical protein HMPREF0168_1784 [Bifidobacterium dentium ATCC 27679]